MKIWTEPKVSLLAGTRTYITNSPYKFETDAIGDDEYLVEHAGRLCYMSFGKGEADGHKTVQGRVGNEEYIKNIINQKHGSVLEHANYTVLIEGVSRSLTHELVRHRHFSYSQLSQRYVEESDVGFVVPPEILGQNEVMTIWEDMCSISLDHYNRLLRLCNNILEDEEELTKVKISIRDKNKRIRQTARSVLPNCTETKIVMTGNARAWMHFFNLRGNIHADTEIRRLAVEIYSKLGQHSPNLFQNVVWDWDNGTLTVKGGSI